MGSFISLVSSQYYLHSTAAKDIDKHRTIFWASLEHFIVFLTFNAEEPSYDIFRPYSGLFLIYAPYPAKLQSNLPLASFLLIKMRQYLLWGLIVWGSNKQLVAVSL